MYLPFPTSQKIDLAVVEYLETGEQITRTPRQWAKSLLLPDEASMEVDMESGTSDGSAILLILPSASLEYAKVELTKYCQRQNPTLMNAERFYTESVLEDPDIPLTVFTQNIEKILAKKIKKTPHPHTTGNSVLSPESSVTGMTSKTSKSSNAWRRPLQKSSTSTKVPTSAKPPSATDRELKQQQRIVLLEAQLASLSAGNSKASGDRSQLSGDSPNSLATAHARLDGIESAVLNIQTLLQKMQAAPRGSSCPDDDNAHWPKISGKQLFRENTDDTGLQLVLLSSPASPSKLTNPKRRKAPSSPTDSNLHYKATMGSSGEDPC